MKKKMNRQIVKHMVFNTDLLELSKKEKLILAGSYVRGDSVIGDLDIIVLKQNWPEIRKVFENESKLTDNYKVTKQRDGNLIHSYIVIDRKNEDNQIQVDIRITTEKQLPFAKLYFVGSKMFNVGLRILALAKGYKLTEYCLSDIKTGKCVPGLNTEEDVFNLLGYKYVRYTKRSVTSPDEAIRVIRAGKLKKGN